MTDLPRHPEVDASEIAAGDQVSKPNRAGYVVGAVLVAVLVLVVVLHLTGVVRPAAH